jgi:hypothetical protein
MIHLYRMVVDSMCKGKVICCLTNPSFVNRVEKLPPIGASDHDIVYSEINLALPQNKQQAHKVLNRHLPRC